jgi:hypothetical protein
LNSPALAVNIDNQNVYTPRTLDELKEVKAQVISWQLSKMPVKVQDVKYITGFEKRHKLNLNFTDVTGEGLRRLVLR